MNYISPIKLFTMAWLVWVFIDLISPLKFNIIPSVKGIIILIFFIFSFYLGNLLYIILPKKYEVRIGKIYPKKIRMAAIIILSLALIGILLRYYDFIFIKGFVNYSSITDFRLNYSEGDVSYSIVTIIGSILMPMAIGTLMLSIYFGEIMGKTYKTISIILLIGLLSYFVLRGGRTTISLIFIMLITTLIFSGYNFKHLKPYLIIFVPVFFLYSIILLKERLNYMGFQMYSHLAYWEKTRHFNLDEKIFSMLLENNFIASIIYTLISLIYYFQHGIYQFLHQIEFYSSELLTYGGTTFYPIYKLLGIIGLPIKDATFIQQTIWIDPGFYYSFYGPILMDFGYFGFVFCILLGYYAQYSWKQACSKEVTHLMIYPYIASLIIHMPFLNMINYGMGLYFFIAMVLCGLICKILGVKNLYSFI